MNILVLWFDVESRYKATEYLCTTNNNELWFDVESRYKATILTGLKNDVKLWFDVESRYKATPIKIRSSSESCGLM